jgi:hypothetical protein
MEITVENSTSSEAPTIQFWMESYMLSILGSILIAILFAYIFQAPKLPGVFFVNPKKFFEFSDSYRKTEFMKNPSEVVRLGQETAHGKPFRAITEFGDTIVLPASYAHEIRNEPNLTFARLIEEVRKFFNCLFNIIR